MPPLKPGIQNIGNNIKEMQSAGHPRNQSVAAALNKAYGKPKAPAAPKAPKSPLKSIKIQMGFKKIKNM